MFLFWSFIYLLIGVIVAFKSQVYSKSSFVFISIIWLPMFLVGLAIIALMIWEERSKR
ncbi:hypothetical protein PP657_gp111 [Bacillus phage BCPST]|uniref:Uncharacterized protein n=2 Tax=Yihwangvirus TaxID=3044863 RepID=A0AAE7TQ83_9CAUD|nr:hypothetical protein PP656_gp021 [Bacillus phage pW4]YP_010657346.1 hypothetical protein PP657_gp111 [Bacillus phage BCPST]AZU99046.1 hypothetical protein pW4_24 [Bacillus phage pW4]QQO38711.1 hypothetical protein BCPST_093 [Bacillus phage BCPST]